MQCGGQNTKEDKRCKSCGAIMPHYEMTPTVKVEVVTGRFKIFHDAVEAVKTGNMPVEAFYELLQNQYAILLEKRGEIETILHETNYAETAATEVSQGIQGMDHYEMGVQEMSMFCEDGEVIHLENGLDMIRMGNDMLNDAKRINRMDRKKLEEEWGWM